MTATVSAVLFPYIFRNDICPFIRHTVRRVLHDSEISRIADMLISLQDKEDSILPALRKQLAETEKGLDNLLDAIQQGLLTPSTRKRLDMLENQKVELEISITEAELKKPKYTKQEIVCFISQFKNGNIDDKDYRQRIIDIFINSIFVFDDKLVFTYNFKGGTETVTLDEINAVLSSDLVGACPPTNNTILA